MLLAHRVFCSSLAYRAFRSEASTLRMTETREEKMLGVSGRMSEAVSRHSLRRTSSASCRALREISALFPCSYIRVALFVTAGHTRRIRG